MDFKKLLKCFILAIAFFLCSLAAYGQKTDFKREEKMPAGKQTNLWASALGSGFKDVNVVEYTFEAPFEEVWPAVKRVASRFEKDGGRPIVGVNENASLIQNGKITQDQMQGARRGAWLDEFQMSAVKIDSANTKVIVSRKVIESVPARRGAWTPLWSNGKIEKYLLTQVEYEIRNPVMMQARAVESEMAAVTIDPKSVPGKYVNKDNSAEYMELNDDGSFFGKEKGKGFAGTYKINSSTITFILPNGSAAQAKLLNNTILDEDAKTWVKQIN